jgi:hypothetical protein
MNEISPEDAAAPANIAIFTRYTVIADGNTIFESAEWGEAYHFFLDHRYDAGVRDLQFIIKRRLLPASGQYPDIVW